MLEGKQVLDEREAFLRHLKDCHHQQPQRGSAAKVGKRAPAGWQPKQQRFTSRRRKRKNNCKPQKSGSKENA